MLANRDYFIDAMDGKGKDDLWQNIDTGEFLIKDY